MKQEEVLDWMLEQGIVEDISVAKEFTSAITQEQLDSFGDAPVIVVGCMWEGWKLAKSQTKVLDNPAKVGRNKNFEVGMYAKVVKDSLVDGCPLEEYGFNIGDNVKVIRVEEVDNGTTVIVCSLESNPGKTLGFLKDELELF